MSTLMSEGVGKRIVDALKMQNDLEIIDKTQSVQDETFQADEVLSEDLVSELTEQPNLNTENDYSPVNQQQSQFQTVNYSQPASMSSNVQKNSQFNYQPQMNVQSDFSNQDVPQNVAILKQLISQLPSGVSRQAGALVIKQTMEALGISMKSVLQEAQQLQESINLSSRECQSSILECKKQINNLELQVQQYQKQSSALNDIISLFVQIN